MNVVNLIGRVTKDPSIAYTGTDSSMCVAKNTLAVDRKGKDKGADFISLVAFSKNAEFMEKYVTKGTKLGVVGHIVTGSYTNKEGNTIFTTDVVVDSVEFCEKKSANTESVSDFPITSGFTPNTTNPTADGFMNIPAGIDEDLPFAPVSR